MLQRATLVQDAAQRPHVRFLHRNTHRAPTGIIAEKGMRDTGTLLRHAGARTSLYGLSSHSSGER